MEPDCLHSIFCVCCLSSAPPKTVFYHDPSLQIFSGSALWCPTTLGLPQSHFGIFDIAYFTNESTSLFASFRSSLVSFLRSSSTDADDDETNTAAAADRTPAASPSSNDAFPGRIIVGTPRTCA